jgi:SAM-dependent methyltransferase
MSTAPTLPPEVNHWPDRRCAKAFWSQSEARPYRRLLADTVAWLEPAPGQRWLDLGCGSGQLSRALWEKSGGTLAEVVALDCAEANADALARAAAAAQPPAPEGRLRFHHADFSSGLADFPAESFDGAVSGLAIQYAQCWSAERGCWTTEGYEHLLREAFRVLRPGGAFVFSVNVPEPGWARVALCSVASVFTTRRPLLLLKNSLRMLRYGSWLKREARRGRFHYLPLPAVVKRLERAGFVGVEHRLSFARQAFVLRCRKPQ